MATETGNKHLTEMDGYESWRTAQEFADILGRPHTLFVGAIKLLTHVDHANENAGLYIRRSPLDLVYLTSSIKSVIYFAAGALHPGEIPAPEELTGTTLLNVFSGDELASVLAIAFLTSNVSKKVDKKIWEELLGEVQMQAEVGARLGATIPSIGVGCGMLCGAIRYISMSLFSLKDARAFKAFRRQLDSNEMLFDLKYEEAKWGCNHLQISSLLLQGLGFGVAPATGVGLGANQPLDSAEGVRPEALRWKHARLWIESLLQNERVPEGVDPKGKYFPSEQALSRLQERIDSINLGGGTFSWTQRRKEDLPPEILARLSIISRPAAAAAAKSGEPAAEHPEEGSSSANEEPVEDLL